MTALHKLHFDGYQSPVTKQLLDQCLRRADPRDTVPDEDDPALAVELHLLQPHRLLDAAHQFLRVLQRDRLRQGNGDRDDRLGLGPLLYCVLDHQEAPFPDRHHERRSRGLQGSQRFPVVGVVQPEAQCGAGLIVGVKNSVQAIGPGDLGEQPLRVALQIQVPPVWGGFQLLRWLRLARRGERFALRHTGRGWRFRAGWNLRFHRLGPQGGCDTQSLAAEPVVQVVRSFSNRLAVQEIGSDDIARPLGLLPLFEQTARFLLACATTAAADEQQQCRDRAHLHTQLGRRPEAIRAGDSTLGRHRKRLN